MKLLFVYSLANMFGQSKEHDLPVKFASVVGQTFNTASHSKHSSTREQCLKKVLPCVFQHSWCTISCHYVPRGQHFSSFINALILFTLCCRLPEFRHTTSAGLDHSCVNSGRFSSVGSFSAHCGQVHSHGRCKHNLLEHT